MLATVRQLYMHIFWRANQQRQSSDRGLPMPGNFANFDIREYCDDHSTKMYASARCCQALPSNSALISWRVYQTQRVAGHLVPEPKTFGVTFTGGKMQRSVLIWEHAVFRVQLMASSINIYEPI